MHRVGPTTFRWLLAEMLFCISIAGNPARVVAEEFDTFTEPYQSVEISAAEAGTIQELAVREGDRVKEGQLLVRLDDELYRSALDIAIANRDSTGKLETAIAELELQVDTWKKLVELEARQHASPQEVERALAQKVIAEARLKTVREEMQVRSLEFARAKLQLDRRSVLSPMDGIVVQMHREKGELVTIADPVLVTVVQLDPLAAVFSVRASTARRFQPQQKVTLALDELGTSVEGVIEFISPTSDAQSGTTRLRVRIPNPDEKLPSGVSCRLMVPDSEPSNLAKSVR